MQNCLNRYKTNLKYFFAISDVIIHLIYVAYTSTLLELFLHLKIFIKY